MKIIKLFILSSVFCMLASCDNKEEHPDLLAQTVKVGDHMAVDLFLSVKWATCNIGAECETDFGSYFAWGETSGKESYSWDHPGDYSMGVFDLPNRPDCGMEKYNSADQLRTLAPEHDAATQAWGEKWRTPTADEIEELIRECTWERASVKDKSGKEVYGYLVTPKSLTGGSLFFPFAGAKRSDVIEGGGVTGSYWSSTVCSPSSFNAECLDFPTKSPVNLFVSKRYMGLPIRAVTEE